MKIVKAINNALLKLLDVLSILLMVGMVVFLFVQLVARSAFGSGLHWTEESAKICLIMLAYIGAAMTSINGVHVNVTMLSDALQGVAKKIVYVIQQLLAMGFLVLVVVFSGPALEIASKSVATKPLINNAIIFAIVLISFVIMFFGHLARIIAQFTTKDFVKDVDEDRSGEASILENPDLDAEEGGAQK